MRIGGRPNIEVSAIRAGTISFKIKILVIVHTIQFYNIFSYKKSERIDVLAQFMVICNKSDGSRFYESVQAMLTYHSYFY